MSLMQKIPEHLRAEVTYHEGGYEKNLLTLDENGEMRAKKVPCIILVVPKGQEEKIFAVRKALLGEICPEHAKYHITIGKKMSRELIEDQLERMRPKKTFSPLRGRAETLGEGIIEVGDFSKCEINMLLKVIIKLTGAIANQMERLLGLPVSPKISGI
jgi:hypothetical protein